MDRPPAAWILSDAPYAGGAERYLEYLLRAAGPERLGLIAVEHPGLVQWIQSIEDLGFVVDRIPPSSLVAQWAAFANWCRRRRPRLVHVNMPGPNDGLFALAPLLAKMNRVPRVVVTEHLPSVGRIGRRGLLKRLTSFAVDRAITVCRAHLEVMAREFGYSDRQLVAIPNAIPDPILDPGIAAPQRTSLPEDLVSVSPPGCVRMVQVGSLDDRKGGARLLEAFAEARCDASLWFVGEGPARETWTRLAAELGVAGRVVFTGRRDDLPRLLDAFDLVVLVSDREGMPYVLIEAMAMARPILATGVDGVPELVESTVNGIAIGPADDIAIARELRTLSADPNRLHRMGARGRERFETNHRFDEFLERTWRQYGEEASGWPTNIDSS